MKKTSVKKIKNCRICKSTNIILVLDLGDLYLSDFLKSNKKPERYPLNIVLCLNCFLLQLESTAPSSSLYTKRYGYRSGINDTMKKELKTIVNKSLEKYGIHKVSKEFAVLDIGANDGTLLSNYSKKYFRIAVEPIKKFAPNCKVNSDKVVSDFFNYKSVAKKIGNKKINIITAISCFYDIDKPNDFVNDISKLLAPNGIFVIQQNYLAEMLRLNAFDNIVHEHLEYYSLLSLEKLLSQHNLEVFDVELSYINGGSFRTYISRKGEREISDTVLKMRQKEKKLKLDDKQTYLNFAKRVSSNGKKIYDFIEKEKSKGKITYIYGASTRGNTLLQFFNLDYNLIPAAVERNKEKWGCKISSVGIPIISEKEARKHQPDYMLVLPWFFKEEFIEREKEYLKRGGHFIFPLPKMEIV